MEKKEIVNFITCIAKYLKISSDLADSFLDVYKSMKEYEDDKYSVIPHGIGLSVFDKISDIEIEFDYFNYDGLGIRYFELWKFKKFVSKFCNKKYITRFDEYIIFLLENGYIKRYYTHSYYFLTSKGLSILNNNIFR